MDEKKFNVDQAAARAAIMTIEGVGLKKQVELLSKEFNQPISRDRVLRLRTRDVFIRIRKEHMESLISGAVAELKADASRLVPKVTAALEQALDDGNIQAVPHILKILGVDGAADSNDNSKQAQQMVVVLPGAKIPNESAAYEKEVSSEEDK